MKVGGGGGGASAVAAWVAATAAALLAGLAASEAVVARGWRPSLGIDPFKPFLGPSEVEGVPTAIGPVAAASDQCALYKVGFNQELYFQYVQYKVNLPDFLQFTLCTWMKFTNHSNDHPIFSYAVPDQPRAIFSWVSNSQRSSYLSMSVNGHTFYRLNYPFRLHRWYHSCQSWNGKTGEWQAWVNAERVGRGFHNRLVGHTIPGGGVALSGQEQRQPGGGFLEGAGAPKGSGGMLGELTLLHLYAAALAPGKAHRDHKHHHGNHYQSNPPNGVSPNAPPLPSVGSTIAPVPQFMSQYLVGGQLAPTGLHIAAQLAGLTRPVGEPHPGAAAILQGYGGVGGAAVAAVATAAAGGPPPPGAPGIASAPATPSAAAVAALFPAELVQHQLFKRNEGETKSKRQVSQTLVEDLLNLGQTGDYNPLSVPEDVLLAAKAKTTKDDYPREPAEGEVLQVMNVCSGCAREPFKKVELISWRTTPKKLYSGALYTPATPQCRKF